MSTSAVGSVPDDVAELHEREGVGDLEGVAGVFLDEEDGAAAVAQLDDGFDDGLGGERREAEGGFVGDEDGGRVGEGGCEAEHLLLTAGEQAGDLAAPLVEDGEPVVGLGAQVGVADLHDEVLLDGEPGEDAAGFGDEERRRRGRGGTVRAFVMSSPRRRT